MLFQFNIVKMNPKYFEDYLVTLFPTESYHILASSTCLLNNQVSEIGKAFYDMLSATSIICH